MDMHENEIADKVLDAAFDIHRKLGPGLMESVYETILEYELVNTYGLKVSRQERVSVVWKDIKIDKAFRSDLIVEGKVLIELKSVENINLIHFKQVLSHIKLLGIKLGLLINFNSALLKHGIKRVVNRL